MQENNYFRTQVIFDLTLILKSVWLNMSLTIHYNLHACWDIGGWGKFLKESFLSYTENPEVCQRADVVQQKTQVPDQRPLRKLSSSQLQFTCPKARAPPSLLSDKH